MTGKPAAKTPGAKRQNRDDDNITSEESDGEMFVCLFLSYLSYLSLI